MIRIALPATVDLPAAVSLADSILTAATAATIDATAVERIGLPGLQLLLCAQATAEAAGLPIVIEHPSVALVEAARLAGVEQTLAPAFSR